MPNSSPFKGIAEQLINKHINTLSEEAIITNLLGVQRHVTGTQRNKTKSEQVESRHYSGGNDIQAEIAESVDTAIQNGKYQTITTANFQDVLQNATIDPFRRGKLTICHQQQIPSIAITNGCIEVGRTNVSELCGDSGNGDIISLFRTAYPRAPTPTNRKVFRRSGSANTIQMIQDHLQKLSTEGKLG